MKNSTKKILSFALASTIIAGVPVSANASDNNANIIIEQSYEDNITYEVKNGDTLGKISERYYGNAGYWELLAKYNNLKNPNKLNIGDKLSIPNNLYGLLRCEYDVSYEEEATIIPVQYEEDKTYTVQKGDTLYCIVRVQYGLTNQESVDKLATYNNLSDPNKLSVGQVLFIPCVEKLQQVTQRDYSNEYNRMGYILNNQNSDKTKEQGCWVYVYPCNTDQTVLDGCPNLILKP